PLVPYHALPRLHAAVRDDMPVPYRGIAAAYREIIPTLFRQVKDPAHHVKRRLPPRSSPQSHVARADSRAPVPDASGWIEVCAAADLGREDVLRFDHGRKTYALYRDAGGRLYAT